MVVIRTSTAPLKVTVGAGIPGPRGKSINIKATLTSVANLPTKPVDESDSYLIGGDLYVWATNKWVNAGKIQGPVGPTGAMGSTGPEGPQGISGAIGAQGPKGDTGAPGATGPQGVIGLTGEAGPAGQIGPQGPQGIQGVIGQTGPQGVQGPIGATGPRGAIGPAGLIWRNNWNDTVDYVEDDAVYYDGASWFAGNDPALGEVPSLESANWQPLALRGATGAQGIQGVQGIPGVIGPKGDTGATGPAGPVNTDALARANHTGVQAISTITNLQSILDGKVSMTAAESIGGNKTFTGGGTTFQGNVTAFKTGTTADQNGVELIISGDNSSIILNGVYGMVKKAGLAPAFGYSAIADFLVQEYTTINGLRDFPRAPATQRMKIARNTGEVDFNSAVLRIAGKQVATSEELTNAAATKVNHTQTYSANGAKSGFHLDLSLDYDTTVVTLNEPIMVKARTDSTALTRAFWLNESGAVRGAAIKLDPAARFYGPPTDSPNTVVLDIHSSDKVAGRGPRWGIDAAGRPRLGPNREMGSHVLVLAAGAAVPADLPPGTVIMRTA